MNTTGRILFILFGSLGYSEILSVVLPQLRIQVCCSHYFWFQKLCLLDIRICFGPVLAKPAMFYPVKTWKYKNWHDIISSSCWKSWGKPKPLRGKRNLSIEGFRQSCFIASNKTKHQSAFQSIILKISFLHQHFLTSGIRIFIKSDHQTPQIGGTDGDWGPPVDAKVLRQLDAITSQGKS